MKIIQSFWSKPSYKKKNVKLHDRNNGGWTDKKYNYFSWALSCLQFRKYYDDVELITDEIGYNILIEKLKLPYTKVDVCLDKINHYHEDLWALGKIYAYSIQNTPFIFCKALQRVVFPEPDGADMVIKLIIRGYSELVPGFFLIRPLFL